MRLTWPSYRQQAGALRRKAPSERLARPGPQNLRAVQQQSQPASSQQQPGPTHQARSAPSKGMQAEASSNKIVRSFFYFDPENPESVVEVRAAGSSNKEGLPAARPRAVDPAAGKIVTTSQDDGALSPKAALIQQELLAQLEQTRSKLQEMQVHEAASREWRIRAQQASAELSALQRALVEKDNELASAYKRLESAAAERVALRRANLSLDEETRSLKALMDEVQLLGSSWEAPVALLGQGLVGDAADAAMAAGATGASPNGNGKE